MDKIKIGDWVRVTKGEDTERVAWLSNHREGIFTVTEVDDSMGRYRLKDGNYDFWYDSTWCELITPKIDLTKPQLIEGDVKFKVWQDGMNLINAVERYLAFIAPDGALWFWRDGFTGINLSFNYRGARCWDNAELIEEPPQPKTRLMTRREIKAKILSMDKENPFLVGFFDREEHIKTALEKEWKIATSVILHHYKIEAHYFRHIHPITGEWTSEPSQFLIEDKEGEELKYNDIESDDHKKYDIKKRNVKESEE